MLHWNSSLIRNLEVLCRDSLVYLKIIISEVLSIISKDISFTARKLRVTSQWCSTDALFFHIFQLISLHFWIQFISTALKSSI
jgi:hypothetical protein